MTNKNKHNNINYKKIRNVIIIGGISIFILLILFRYGSVYGFYWFLNDFQSTLTDVGINKHLAKALGIPYAGLAIYALILLFSIKKEKFIRGGILYGLLLIFTSLLLFIITKDHHFGKDGNATMCKAYNPYTRQFDYIDCSNTVHPKYGTIVQPCDRPIERIIPNNNTRCFSSDGYALLWYYQDELGKLEFFGQPGVYPQLGCKLNPINQQIAKKMLNYIKNDRGMIRGTNIKSKQEINNEKEQRELAEKRKAAIIKKQKKEAKEKENLREVKFFLDEAGYTEY